MTTLSGPHAPDLLNRRLQDGTLRLPVLAGLLLARSGLCFLAQTGAAAVFWAQGAQDPWLTAVPYWNVFGTLADVGCLLLLRHFLKPEGLSVWDLVRGSPAPMWRDLLIGVGLFLAVFPTAIMGFTILANLAVYGALQPDLGSGLLIERQLPAWAALYSLVVWWVIWAPTESAFYNGYLFPRLEAATGRTWLAVLGVGFFWALQHVFFPLLLDWRYVAWRFLQFLGIGLLMPWLFSRMRRLRPLIVTHWLMDFAGVALTLKF